MAGQKKVRLTLTENQQRVAGTCPTVKRKRMGPAAFEEGLRHGEAREGNRRVPQAKEGNEATNLGQGVG